MPMRQWQHALVKSWDPQKDFSFGMQHAERLTRLLCASAIAEVLVGQAESCRGTSDEVERMKLAERWLSWVVWIGFALWVTNLLPLVMQQMVGEGVVMVLVGLTAGFVYRGEAAA